MQRCLDELHSYVWTWGDGRVGQASKGFVNEHTFLSDSTSVGSDRFSRPGSQFTETISIGSAITVGLSLLGRLVGARTTPDSRPSMREGSQSFLHGEGWSLALNVKPHAPLHSKL